MRFVAENATPQDLSTREIERASRSEEELTNVRECIQKEQWQKLENKRHLMVRSELSVIAKLVLRGTRIVIPSSLREGVVSLAHEGYPGTVCKVRWPNCDKDAEKFCKSCPPCQWLQCLHIVVIFCPRTSSQPT